MKRKNVTALFGFLLLAVMIAWQPQAVFGHCDSLDGPVIISAQKAIKAGDVNLVLHWVSKEDEAEVTTVFKKTMAVRKAGAVAKELADTYFFETLVRIHRAGEGAPYTGLKPAGQTGHAVMMADQSLEKGSVDKLAKAIAEKVEQGIRLRFQEALKKKNAAGNRVEAGREAVAAYVDYVHFVEGIHKLASAGAAHDHEQHNHEQKHACDHN